MQEEVIYRFKILLYSDTDELVKSINCNHWEFPDDEEIKAAIKENNAAYAEVHRIYTVEKIPFTEDD